MADMYTGDQLLALSGVQHFAYCPRQWALIHVEQAWADNVYTVDGNRQHERCHDECIREHRGGLIVVRGLRVVSYELGLSGICDVVEFRQNDSGVELSEESGKWMPTPVEYKRGSSKPGNEDRLQVCAQAVALEEMMCCSIDRGILFYGSKKRREEVEFTSQLRSQLFEVANEMHSLFRRGVTPKAKRRSGCRACSLLGFCMPELESTPSASDYITEMLRG